MPSKSIRKRDIMYTYNILYKSDPDRRGISPEFKTISEARLFFRNVLEHKGSDFYNDIDEVIVFKTSRNARGHKIHGYYDADFKLDKSKIADVHNVLYGYVH